MTELNIYQVGTDFSSLGEGPHWECTEQVLYYIDILGNDVVRYDPISGDITRVKAGIKFPSFIIPVTKGHRNEPKLFVVGSELKILVIRWDGVSQKVDVVEELATFKGHESGRLNDGKADFNGRLFTGSMEIEGASDLLTSSNGSLLSISPLNNEIKVHLTGVGISNGLAWNKSTSKMYYSDSTKYNIKEYDYDAKNANLSNERIVINLKDPVHALPDCLPDGITIDTEGKLWIALFNGSRVVQVDPVTGTILNTVNIPTKQVTSVCWGGKNLDILYVTTAAIPSDGVEIPKPAGALYKIVGLKSRGFPANTVNLN